MDDLNKWTYSRRLSESWTIEQAEKWTDSHDNGDYDFINEMSLLGMMFVDCFYI